MSDLEQERRQMEEQFAYVLGCLQAYRHVADRFLQEMDGKDREMMEQFLTTFQQEIEISMVSLLPDNLEAFIHLMENHSRFQEGLTRTLLTIQGFVARQGE